MSLQDKLSATPVRRNGMPCSVGALLERLPDDERDALQSMLGPLGWPATRIYEALVVEGHEVGRQTISRHRSRACRCFNGVKP